MPTRSTRIYHDRVLGRMPIAWRMYEIECDRREDAGENRQSVEDEAFHRLYDERTCTFKLPERRLVTALIRYKKEELKAIGEVARLCSPSALAQLDDFEQTLTMAAAMNQLNELITPPMMKDIMLLKDSPLGFLTDRPPGAKDREGKLLQPYTEATVKRCFIEATLRGAKSVGNEWNILAGRVYITKQFFERTLRDYPGLSHLKLIPSVPKLLSGGAIVKYRAEWKLNGKTDSMDREIAVRVNAGMGADAILGKAERKIRSAIFRQLTGSTWDEADDADSIVNDPNVIDTTGEIVDVDAVAAEQGAAEAPGTELADSTDQPESAVEPEAAAPPSDQPSEPSVVPEEQPPFDPSETALDRVLRLINEAPDQATLKQIYDQAAKAAQKEEVSSDDWSKVSAARRKRDGELKKAKPAA